MKAETIRRPLFPPWARTLRMKWTPGLLMKFYLSDSIEYPLMLWSLPDARP